MSPETHDLVEALERVLITRAATAYLNWAPYITAEELKGQVSAEAREGWIYFHEAIEKAGWFEDPPAPQTTILGRKLVSAGPRLR